MFIKPVFYFAVRKFVCTLGATTNIFMGLNTKYRANLVKARVNVPVTLLHIYWVCQYTLFLISEDWERFTEPSKPSLPCQIQHCFECIFKLFLKTVFNLFCEVGFK